MIAAQPPYCVPWIPTSMKPSPQNRSQPPQGRISVLRADLSGSGKAARREQVVAERQKRAKLRARPRPAPETWQHEAASEHEFTGAAESAQDFPAARSTPSDGGSAAAETQEKKPILRQGPVAELLPATSSWSADRSAPYSQGHLRGRRREGPHRAMELGLADSAADEREDAVCAGSEWAHRRDD
jgi:hypothetical protein